MNIEKNKMFFWLIETSTPKLEIALNKLGMSEQEINYFLTNVNLHIPHYKKNIIWVAPYNTIYNSNCIQCNWDYCEKHVWFNRKREGYIFKGKIKVSDLEINQHLFKV